MSNYLQIQEFENNQSENLTDYDYIEPEEEIVDQMEPESIFDSFQTIKELCEAVKNPYK
jgi:hypothetical protein